MNKNIFFKISFVLISIISIVLTITNEGTGGNGDSVLHYLYARYSWVDTQLFFNHWAKPFFTFVSSIFAQFGFMGIKLMNVIISLFTIYLSYLCARELKFKYAHLIFIPLYFSPIYFEVMYSGLTEPLSALLIISFLYLWLKKYEWSALLLISFLPFVRSEGLVVLIVVLFFLLWKKRFLLLPSLLFGHLAVAIAGWVYYKDLLWVVNKIPYATMSSVYGQGNYTHFFNQLYFCLGLLTYIFLIIGFLNQVISYLFKRDNKQYADERFFLVSGIFAAFFTAHTLFWALGIFNSMGLTRVFVTVLPLVALTVIYAFEIIAVRFKKASTILFPEVISVLIIILSFSNNKSSINYKKNLSLDESQQLLKNKVVPYLKENYPTRIYLSADPSLALFSNRNYFDDNEFLSLYDFDLKNITDTNIVFIYDPWFAKTEARISIEDAMRYNNIEIDTVFKTESQNTEKLEYVIFKKSNSIK